MSFLFGSPKQSSTPKNVDDFLNTFKDTLLKSSQNSDKKIGINLGDKTAFTKEIDELVSSIRGSYTKYTTEMGKYAKVKELNKKLSASFEQNLSVMIDVSNLLASYKNLFDVLRTEVIKLNEALGKEVNIGDFDYLNKLTEENIVKLQQKYTEQAKMLDTIYKAYDLKEESTRSTIAAATASEVIKNAEKLKSGQAGGKRGKKLIRKK